MFLTCGMVVYDAEYTKPELVNFLYVSLQHVFFYSCSDIFYYYYYYIHKVILETVNMELNFTLQALWSRSKAWCDLLESATYLGVARGLGGWQCLLRTRRKISQALP